MLVKWLGLFPVLLVLAYGLKMLNIEPLWFKLLLETAILVPLLNYVITPFMDSVFSDWLYKDVDDKQRDKAVSLRNGPGVLGKSNTGA